MEPQKNFQQAVENVSGRDLGVLGRERNIRELNLPDAEKLTAEKRNKKRRLNRKERARLRAVLKEVRRRRNIVDHYERENKLFYKNIKKVCDKWEDILKKLRSEELMEDWQDLQQHIQKYLTKKEEQVTILIADFEIKVDERRMLSAAHIEALDRLLEIGEPQLDVTWNEYCYASYNKQRTIEKEITDINDKGRKASEHLQLIQFQQQGVAEDIKSCLKAKHDEAMQDLESEQWTEIDKVEHEVDNLIELMLIEMSVRIQSYVFFTNGKQNLVAELKQKEDFFQKMREADFLKIKLNKKEVIKLKKVLCRAKELELEVKEKKEEKERTVLYYKYLQSIMEDIAKDDRNKLKQLCVISEYTINNLREKLAVFERILRLKAQCTPYEYPQEHKTLRNAIYLAFSERTDNNKLNGFWEHIGKTQLTVTDLDKELHLLENENRHLRQLLCNHFKTFKFGYE